MPFILNLVGCVPHTIKLFIPQTYPPFAGALIQWAFVHRNRKANHVCNNLVLPISQSSSTARHEGNEPNRA